MSIERTPIAQFLQRNRLRIVDLAKAADVTWPTAQSWVKGDTFPTTEHIGRVRKWLLQKGISPILEDFLPAAA